MTAKRSSGVAADVLTKLMRTQQHAMAKAFEDATHFKHKDLRGGERERGVRKFLSEQLPGRLKVATGESIDRFGNTSAQIDVMVYDASLNAPFAGESNDLLPAEALLAIVEVKTRLTKSEWKKVGAAIEKFRKLRPYKQAFDISKAGRSGVRPKLPRCFYSVVAFSSDLSLKKDDWARRELLRASEAIGSFDCEGLDRILILDRGMINPTEGVARSSDSPGDNLMAWYVGLANLLYREMPRRDPMDWQIYAGKTFGDWEEIF
jgi:hypothetical protein